MEPKIRKVNLDKSRRIIVISDIHNRVDLLKKLLDKVNFNDDDYLIINGDFIEKGSYNSVEAFKYIMELDINHSNVFVIMGNCDDVWLRLGITTKSVPYMQYLLNNPNSFVRQLCEKSNIKISLDLSASELCEELKKLYPEMWDYLNSVPHVLETSDYIFVHGGFNPNLKDYGNEAHDLMKFDNFEASGYVFDKYVIVGHWPVSNYCHEIISYNPRVNTKQKIISIDGGNSIKSSGQLNALIIKDNQFSYESIDDISKSRVICNYVGNIKYKPFSIVWSDSEIEVLSNEGEFSLVRHISSSKKVKVLTKNIYLGSDGKSYCWDSTTNHLTVHKGDYISIVYRGERYSLAKKNGELGWIRNDTYKD